MTVPRHEHARLQSIQVLRALAAFLVVYAHTAASVTSVYNLPLWRVHADSLATIGTIGVDIFFVISGFVITFIVRSTTLSSWEFAIKRIIRIYPIYYFIFAVFILKLIFLYHQTLSAKDLVNSLLLVPLYEANPNRLPLLTVCWTLYFEMFFYFLAFLILTFAKRRYFVPILCAVLLTLSLLHLGIDGSHHFLTFVTNPIILEFGAGCLLSQLYFSKKIPTPWLYLALGVSLVWISYLANQGFPKFDDAPTLMYGYLCFERVFLFGTPAILLVFFGVNVEKNGFRSWPEFAVQLGNSSYCLYLLHVVLMVHVILKLQKYGPATPGIAVALTMIVIIAAAHILHLLVERPLQRYVSNLFVAKKDTKPNALLQKP